MPTDSYALSETKAHDQEAMRYLSMLMYPLVAGYALYSLSHDTHKSWYSWLLGSVVGRVLRVRLRLRLRLRLRVRVLTLTVTLTLTLSRWAACTPSASS